MKKILVFTFIFFAAFGCTKLDDTLYDRILPSDYTADPILKMSPIYEPMRDFLDWGGWWFAQEVTTDAVVCPTRAGDWDDGGKWRVLHQHAWDNNTEAITSMWGRFFGGAIEANKFIEEFASEAGNPVIDVALAKASILRAYYYYLLIDNYGDVPYITKYLDADPQPHRNFRKDIYNEIVKEVEQSIPYISTGSSKTGVTKAMAWSLLAKLYLNHAVYTGNVNNEYWTKAEAVCDSIINLQSYSLESDVLSAFVTRNENSPENIWVIPYDEDTYTGFNLHMRTLHYNSNLTFEMVVGPWNGFAVVESHYNTYSPDDNRLDWFMVGQQYTYDGQPIKDQGAGGLPLIFTPHIPSLVMGAGNTPQEIRMSGVRVKKFEIRRGAKENLSNDFPIFRYADVLLMMAEAQLRQGKTVDVPGLDQIRTRAGLPAGWSATLNGQAGLNELLAERGRELFWEAHRRQDLIRFGEFNKAWWEKPASTSDKNVFPIPQWVVDANPNIKLDPVSIN